MTKTMKIKMSKTEQVSRAAIAAALALLFAGSAATVMSSALNAGAAALPLYLSALLAVALCVAGTLSRVGAIGASLGFVAATAAYAVTHTAGLGALRALFAAWSGAPSDAAQAAQAALGAKTLLTCGAFVLGAMFFALLNRREFVSLAIMLLLAMLVACHAMSETASVAATVPGLIAAAAAFALTGGVQRDLSALRVLAPATLAVLLALALLPGGRVTWPPLEQAAERVRSVFEQYFRFTRERIAFSINEEGYDHAGEVGDAVVSMLGGPAEPHTDPVMSVQTDADVLLRGAIRTGYTGYSWVDAVPKSRFLYYDLTHRATRDRVFTPADALTDALLSVDVSVELLSEGTSTLFVPGLLERFDMDLSTAVYYNTAGEMFLSRRVQPGDRYSLRALLPEMNDALRRAVIEGGEANDDRYQDILELHTGLPEGIDGRVYTLTAQIIRDADNDYDRAAAILTWLRRNMSYTLRPEVPPKGRDFVSYFLLESKQGYCSYYASAMAVMCRIAGLPTRYVEGYLARLGLEVLTGENAHAWTEIYFRGVGWIPFDATGGTTGNGAAWEPSRLEGSGDGQDAEGDGLAEAEGDYAEPDVTPTPSPEPDEGLPPEDPSDAPTPQPEDDPQPEEDPFDAQTPESDAESDLPETARGSGAALWLLLILLALIALAAWAARWVRNRLRRSDPARLCREARGLRRAAMIAYRSNLTVLSHLGQTPAGGETPEAFAARVSEALDNPDFVAFTRTVVNAGYGRRALQKNDVETGLRAYERFRASLGRRERLRFLLTRITRGLGDFEAIP